MRILHVIDSLHTGGAERNFAAVIPAIKRHDHRVVCLRDGGVYMPQVREAGVTVEVIPFEKAVDFPRALGHLRQMAAEADLVHTQLTDANLMGRMASFKRTPIVTSVQTTPYEPSIIRGYSSLGILKTGAHWAADVALSRAASLLVAVSGQVRDAVVERVRVAPSKVRVVYNSIDVLSVQRPTAEERRQVRAELGFTEHELVMISVGKVIPAKGQWLLIEAMPALLERVPQARLLIVGDGTQTDELNARIRQLGLTERVRLLGNRDDVMRLLKATDLMAFASALEGLPLSVIEAMATYVPCALSGIQPHREIQSVVARHAPEEASRMVVEAATSRAWTDAMASLLLDAPLRERLAQAGRRAAEEAFDVSTCADQLGTVFEEAVAR